MRRVTREIESRLVQRNAAKQASNFESGSLNSEGHPLWVKTTAWVMAAVMYLSPALFLADEVAHAAPIVDPRAPITFQPTVTQTSTGIPAINIPAPNANGISVGQYQSFGVGPEGLVLNNSTVAGSPLLGGSLGANPNLNGRSASTIINQVTSNAIATLTGPLEVFGAPATVIVSAPGGVSVNGMALTNIPGLTLTTGTPQFLTGVGGTATDFAHAGAVAYNVQSGNISINGPAGNDGTPGAGIEGTVGNIDLIGQSVSLAAPLRADQRVNIVTGNQTVTPSVTGSTGTTYSTAANSAANTAAAIGKTVAVDANQYGSVTSETVYIVSTAAGMGVNTQGQLSATAGNVVVNSNGDIAVGQTFAHQDVTLTSAGNTTISGTGLANQNYTVNANGDINATGSVSAGQNVAMMAGGNLNAASVAANGSANLTAGQSMTIGSLSAHDVALQTTNGDLTVGGLSAPGTISAQAGRDLTVNGAVQGGSTVALTGARNATVNGSVSGVGTTSIAATTGTAQITGSAISNAALSVSAGQSALIGGNVSAQGPLTVTAANGDATLSGTAVTPGALTVSSGGTTTLGGQTQAATANVSGGNVAVNGALTTTGDTTLAAKNGNLTGSGAIGTTQGNVNLSASQNIAYSGGVQSGGAVLAKAGQDATLANVSAPGAIKIQAGRDAAETGNLTGGSTVSMTAGRNATVSGSVASVGDTTITAQTGSAAVNGNSQSNGALAINAGQNASIGGTAQAQGPVSITAQAGSLTGQGNVTSSQGAVSLKAAQAIALGGAVQSGSTIDATAGTNASFGGTVAAPGAVTIQAGQDTTLAGNVTSGGNLSVTSGGNTSVQGTAASVGDMTLAANGGALSTTGNVVSMGALNATGQQGVSLGGTVYSGGNAQIGSTAGSVAVAGAVSTPGTLNINAGQDATVAGTVNSGQSTAISAGRDANLNGGLSVNGTGNASVTAGRDINGSGALTVANDTTLKAGNNVGISGAIQAGNNLSATAGNNLSVGATTAVGTSTLTAKNGSATLTGDALSGGATTIAAGTDVNAQGSVKTLGDLSINATSGNVTATGAVASAGSATLSAGQNLTLNGQTTVSQDTTLTGNNITTQGVAVGGNLTATATNNLDTSAGQLNAQFDASAPALSVNGNATLKGTNVTTANAVVGGTTQIAASQNLTTGGTAAFKGDASLSGNTITNVGTQMAGGNLNVSGFNVTNTGSLSSLQTATVNTTNLNNSGSIYGPTANVNVSNATVNSGSLLATNALNVTTGSLSNSGLLFAGDVKNPTTATGDTTVTVTGGNGSFDNSAGKILAQNVATLNLPNQRLDPSAAIFGTVNGGNGLNLSALAVNNSGTWTLPATAVTVTAAQGITNAGTINQGTGSLVLNSAVGNTGTINGNDLTINGSLANQASGTVTANTLTLNGSGTNAGLVQANNTLTISGTSYDNSGATTRVGTNSGPAGSGNATINLSGDLGNAGGTLTATNNLTIAANNVNNSAAANISTTTSTSTVINSPLLMSTVIGTEAFWYIDAGQSGSLTPYVYSLTSTLGGLLSPGGNSTMVPDPHPSFYEQAVHSATGAPYPTVNLATYYRSAPNANHIASGPTAFQPVATSGPVTFVRLPYAANSSGASGPAYVWVVQDGTVPTGDSNGPYQTQTFTIPTVTETRTSVSGSNTPSVIAAGNNLSLTANTLNNQGGTVSAGHDANLNVQTLNNGGVTYTSSVTDTVDSASLQAFMSGIIALTPTLPSWSGLIPIQVSVRGSGNMYGTYCDSSGCGVGSPNPPAKFSFLAPSAVTVQSVSSSTTLQTPAGQVLAGHDVNLSGGNLVNAGSLTAGNNVDINSSSFTNQGVNNGSKTVTAGCPSGFAGCSSATTTNGNSETYNYQQTNSSVTAGNDIVIAANQVSNTYGNLVARNNVVIGGAGTTATSETQASNVTNTSGAIEAGNDVMINAATLTNTIAAPAQVHQNYGTATPFTGCTSNCEAYVDVKSADPGTITANHNVNLTAGTFSNIGSLVTAQNVVTINASQSASNGNQYLNAYWRSSVPFQGSNYVAWGCANNPSLCANLYGSAYNAGDAQDPAGLPSSVGMSDFVPGTIQAGNTLVVNSPTLTTTGNVIGPNVALTGATLVNGLTNPNVYTPPPAVSGQVISLGPVSVSSYVASTVDAAGFVTNASGQRTSVTGAAGLPSNSPVGVQTVGKPTLPVITTTSTPSGAVAGNVSAGTASTPTTTTVKTIAGETVQVNYLTNNPAGQLVDSVSSASLIAALPSALRPGSVPFYYDPYTENQQIEQAALVATGKSSFYSTPSATDSTSQASVNNQDKAALYGAALEYAEKNNVALGTQLSQAQLAQVNAPMLWYVEQTVPEPGCTAMGNGSCPTVQALMPEVLLPQNFAVVNADGQITGTNVALNYVNNILDTGTITAQNLSINTNSLTLEQRSTNVGTIYDALAGGEGVTATTGTLVQQGGFITAANYQLNAQSIDQIGGALQQMNADGSIDTAGTQAMLANLKNQLGSNFTQSTVSNHLQTSLIASPDDGMGLMVFEAAMAVALSVVTAGAGAALVGAVAGSLQAAVANAVVSSLVTTLANDAVTGNFSLSGLGESLGVAVLTAGLTNGITYNTSTGSLGVASWSQSLSPGTYSLSQLAGTSPVWGTAVSQSTGTVLSNLPQQALAIAAQSTIQAGVSSLIQGGSFLTALRNNAVSSLAAVAANDIGTLGQAQGSIIPTGSIGYDLAHAVLGCASSAAVGTGCASGALGGAISAITANEIATIVTEGQGVTNSAQLAAIAAATSLLSGTAAAALGQNVSGAVSAAQNETLNNTCAVGHNCGTLKSAITDTGRAAWNTAVGIVESIPNVVSGGSLPGYPGYVPFLQGAMLTYDDPDFGSLVSLVGALGIASRFGGGATSTANSGATGGARASASSLIVTAGDVDLANVYAAQIQAAPYSKWDISVTSQGSKFLNVKTDVTAQQFQSNLQSNGYDVTNQGTGKNGDFTVLSNGRSTYTIYTRSSTGTAGAQYFGPGGTSAKFTLKGQ
ncbi:beta strand repeat-containing protein [Burkholderia vietnamiensis]|uniref:beta strand repeat-containing protein n=1 Tax=Burkholderia vietnamiensis TaxID=60552 RepID=UPI001CF5FCAC|nr:filamentous hemagglutinin N-terminal domain-containing protein [Burkholderia vietnamiensis]MCA7988254.1 filamentous hemagglutinin N-terminal domain-containing protein [Burkholderia vietnamiensis]HDR8934503.1 filamentous hemagglutinin N-terminal domain-containing protein [Burkholderia vietnamiensis]